MMKRIKLLLLALSVIGGVTAQSYISWSNFLLDTYSRNPASVDKYFANFKLGGQFRDQWIGFEGAPRTGSAFVSCYIDPLDSQVGLRFMADKIGYTHAMDIGPTFAYSINGGINPVWALNFGVGVHAQNFYYDTDKIVFENEIMQNGLEYVDGIYDKKWSFNFDFGVEFAIVRDRKELLLGAVVQNALSYWKKDLTPFANTNTGYTQVRFPSNDNQDILLGASFMHSKNQYAPNKYSTNIYQWEFNFKYRFYLEKNQLLSPGIIFRTKRTWAPSTREGGILLEYEWNRLVTVAGIYEYPLSTLTSNTRGTFELITIIRFGHPATESYRKKEKERAKRQIIPCKWPTNDSHKYGIY